MTHKLFLSTLAFACSTSLAAGQLVPGFLPQTGREAHVVQPGQLANTLSATPFTTSEKWKYRVLQTFSGRGVVAAAVGAAIGQATNTPGPWGQGGEGFGKRYGSGLAGNLSRQVFAATLESALHEDPRYFPSTPGSTKKQRSWNAVKQVFLCKKDDGTSSFAYGRVISNYGNAQFINLWQPSSNDGVSDGLVRGLIGMAAETGFNFMQEFLPFTRSKALRNSH